MFKNHKEVVLTMTDSRSPKNLKAYKKTSYVIDESAIKGKERRELDVHSNDCLEIGEFYVPVGVIRHIDKHFLTLTTDDKIDLLHRLLHFKETALSHAIFSQIDDRYKCEKKPCRIWRRVYNIILDNKVYEVITIYKTSFARAKGDADIEQVMSMYEIDPSETLRIKTIQNCTLVSHYIECGNERHMRMLYNSTRHAEFEHPALISEENRTKYIDTLDLYHKNNSNEPPVPSVLKERMTSLGLLNEEVIGNMGIESDDKGIKVTIDTGKYKIPSNTLRLYLEERGNDLTVDEMLEIYTSDRLPTVDARIALSIAVNNNITAANGTLGTVVNMMLNVIKTDMLPINKMFLPNTNDNIISTMSYELDVEMQKIKDETGYAVGYIKDKCIYLTK